MLVGRGDECDRIDRLLDDARLGRSGVLLLHGQSGIGKTSLLDYALQRAQGVQVLQVAGAESEADLPYAGLHALLRPVVGLIDELPKTQARALKVALALVEPEEADRLAAYAGTLTLLAEAAEREPLLVLVDDAHWLDRASAEALVFSARRMAGESIAMLFAARDGDAAVFRAEGLPELAVGGLDRESALTLLRERWGARIRGDVAEQIVEATGGNPLALHDVPALLTSEELSGAQPLADPLPVSGEIEKSVRRALKEFQKKTRGALVAAAAGDGRTGVAVDALAPAVEAGLVRLRGDALVFRHPLVRSAVYHAATPAERRAAHMLLADAYTSEDEQDRRAWHLAAAADGPDEVAAASLEGAAERARARGGYASQARALERAAELSPEPDARARRLHEAAVAAYWAGEPVQAIRMAEQALPLAADPLLHADVVHRLAVIADWHGAWKDKIVPAETLEHEAERVEPSDPRRAAALLGVVLQRRFQALETGPALELAKRRAELCASLGGERHLRALQDLARAYGLRGHATEAAATIERVMSEGPSEGALAFATNIAEPLIWLEQYDTGRRLLTASIEEARGEGNAVRLMFELTNLALLELRTGGLTPALTHASEAAELAEHAGNDYFQACNLATLARIAAIRGESEECARRAERAAELAEQLHDRLVGSEARMAQAHLALVRGKPEEAVELLRPVAELARANEVGEPSVLPYAPDLIEALIRAGDLEAGRDELDRLEQLAAATERVWAQAAAARYRAFLAGEGELDDAFGAALALHDGSGFERARTELCYGERLRRARRRVDAREQLRAALDVFDSLQAAPWAERTRAELKATGESIPRRDPTAPEMLTPQELQIAAQVAEGKTNREVGAALFLSPKTVEYHLTHIYRKLDLHSRAELIRQFAAPGAG
jgi:DNA-binding CsgD family transcriptional regulator